MANSAFYTDRTYAPLANGDARSVLEASAPTHPTGDFEPIIEAWPLAHEAL